ncbi:MAG: HAMP domain-containing protein [Hamadaea sp.]|nr:HAMP domain-containing protein [Hamadaea sp.]
MLTIRGNQWQTIQLARSLARTDASLQRFGTVTAILILGAAAAAAFAGHVVARAGLRPVSQLTAAATHVAETRDLSSPIPTDGRTKSPSWAMRSTTCSTVSATPNASNGN